MRTFTKLVEVGTARRLELDYSGKCGRHQGVWYYVQVSYQGPSPKPVTLTAELTPKPDGSNGCPICDLSALLAGMREVSQIAANNLFSFQT
jgi:hypothetical protein